LRSLDCHVGSSVWIYKLLHVVGRQVSAMKIKEFCRSFRSFCLATNWNWQLEDNIL